MVILKIVKAKDRRKTLIEENNSEDEEKYNKQIKVVKKIKKIGIKTSLKIKRRDEDSIMNDLKEEYEGDEEYQPEEDDNVDEDNIEDDEVGNEEEDEVNGDEERYDKDDEQEVNNFEPFRLKNEKSKKKIKIEKIENFHRNKQSKSYVNFKEKGKRGFKRCKSSSCNELLSIRQIICTKCNFTQPITQTQTNKQKQQQKATSTTFESLIAYSQNCSYDGQSNKTHKTKLNIQRVKKNALFMDMFNFDIRNFSHMFEQGIKQLKIEDNSSQQAQKILNSQDSQFIDVKNMSELDAAVKVIYQNGEYAKHLKHFDHWTIYPQDSDQKKIFKSQQFQSNLTQLQTKNKIHMKSNQSSTEQQNKLEFSEEQMSETNPDWRMWILNVGYPVTSLAWQYSSEDNQFLAVGLNLAAWTSQPDKQTINRTLSAYSLNHCHRLGQKYLSNGCVQIFSLNHDRLTNNYQQPLLKANLATVGTPLQILWMPKFQNEKNNKTQDYDVIAVLSSDGTIQFYKYYFNSNIFASFDKSQQIQPILTVRIDDQVILSCFDWLNNLECDSIIAGDQIGNIYFIEMVDSFQSFRISQYYNNAHSGCVTDIKFYKQAKQQEQILFASSGQDGIIKVYDVLGQHFPLLRYESCLKGVKSIEWDIGETRQIWKQSIDQVVTNSCIGMHSQYVFHANENGLVYGNIAEQNRKVAVKSQKKSLPESFGFKISTGTFTKQNREYILALDYLHTEGKNNKQDKRKQDNIKGDIAIKVEEEECHPNQRKRKCKNKQKLEFTEIDNRAYVSSIDVSKGNITHLGIKNKDNGSAIGLLESFLAHGNLGGFLQITKIFS